MAAITFREIRFNVQKEEIMVFFTDHEKIYYGIGCGLPVGLTPEMFASKLRELAACVESRVEQITKELKRMPSPTIEIGIGVLGKC